MNGATKVRNFLEGIKASYLEQIKITIFADQTLSSDFDRCVSLYKDYVTLN